LTAALLLAILSWMARRDPQQATRWRDHPHLVALGTYQGQLAWLAIVAVVLGADEIGGSALLMWIPVAALTAVMWSNVRIPSSVPQPARREEGADAGSGNVAA